MNNNNGGKQRDATRQELFITLNYLLTNCYDKKHTSKTIELTKYAEDNYNVFLDRRRANDILDFLTGCSREFPGILPFKVLKIANKPRYYIEMNVFEKDETKKIAESIFKNGNLSKGLAKKLLDVFLNRTCNQEEKNKIIERLNKNEHLIRRQTDTRAKWTLNYERLRDKQLRFTFRTRKYVSTDACSDGRVWNYLYELRNKPREEDRFCGGIVYEVINLEKDTDVCIYLPDIQGAAILKIDNIYVPENSLFSPQWNEVTYEIDSSKYQTIDDMISAYYKGEAGPQIDIEFKFNVGSRDMLNEKLMMQRIRDYQTFFGKPMEYTLQERDIEIQRGPGQEPGHITAIDLHSSVRCNFSAFRKWFWKDGLYENLVVLNPARLNNRLLSAITERFQRRLEKYGEKELTPEERRERLEQRMQNRRQYLARNDSDDNGNGNNSNNG